MIFSLITEKNSKDLFVMSVHTLKLFHVKTLIDFFVLFWFPQMKN